MFKLIFAGVGVFLAYVFLSSAAAAQYPAPSGSVTSSGSNTEVTCVVVDDAGNPLAGKSIAFQITSNPGGAQLLANQGLSGPDGSVTVGLDPGTVPGQIEVTCRSGIFESTFVTEVAGAISPPATGDGGIADSGKSFGLAGMAFLIASGGALFFRRPKTSS